MQFDGHLSRGRIPGPMRPDVQSPDSCREIGGVRRRKHRRMLMAALDEPPRDWSLVVRAPRLLVSDQPGSLPQRSTEFEVSLNLRIHVKFADAVVGDISVTLGGVSQP